MEKKVDEKDRRQEIEEGTSKLSPKSSENPSKSSDSSEKNCSKFRPNRPRFPNREELLSIESVNSTSSSSNEEIEQSLTKPKFSTSKPKSSSEKPKLPPKPNNRKFRPNFEKPREENLAAGQIVDSDPEMLSPLSNSSGASSSLSSSSENEFMSNFTKFSNDLAGKLKASWTNARYNLSVATQSSFSEKSSICLFGEFYLPQQKDNEENAEEENRHKNLSSPNNNDDENCSKKISAGKNHKNFIKKLQTKKATPGGGGENFIEKSIDDDCLHDYQRFCDDFRNIIWFTYRKGFKTLLADKYDSDCGWGCMLRCGQMMLARTLFVHAAAISKKQDDSTVMMKDGGDSLRRSIIIDFLENAGAQPGAAPFSLHRLVRIGTDEHRREAGQWFAPGSTAQILRRGLDDAHSSANQSPTSSSSLPTNQRSCLYENLSIYVANEQLICTADLDELCCCCSSASQCWDSASKSMIGCGATTRSSRSAASGARKRTDSERLTGVLGDESDWSKLTWSRSLLLIVPLRLGADRMNQLLYVPRLKKLLSLSNCVGLIGGRPKRSLYVVGWHADTAVCLDPHYCQDCVDVLDEADPNEFPLDSFFCENPHTMPFSEMDPSFAIGFYLRDRKELLEFYSDLLDVATFGIGDTSCCKNPLFSILYSRDELCPKATTISPTISSNTKNSNSSSTSRPSSGESNRSYVMI